MDVNGQLAAGAEFPDPAKQALALLEACQGDIREASLFACINALSARNKGDRHYWSHVRLLILKWSLTGIPETREPNES